MSEEEKQKKLAERRAKRQKRQVDLTEEQREEQRKKKRKATSLLREKKRMEAAKGEEERQVNNSGKEAGVEPRAEEPRAEEPRVDNSAAMDRQGGSYHNSSIDQGGNLHGVATVPTRGQQLQIIVEDAMSEDEPELVDEDDEVGFGGEMEEFLESDDELNEAEFARIEAATTIADRMLDLKEKAAGGFLSILKEQADRCKKNSEIEQSQIQEQMELIKISQGTIKDTQRQIDITLRQIDSNHQLIESGRKHRQEEETRLYTSTVQLMEKANTTDPTVAAAFEFLTTPTPRKRKPRKRPLKTPLKTPGVATPVSLSWIGPIDSVPKEVGGAPFKSPNPTVGTPTQLFPEKPGTGTCPPASGFATST